MKPGYKQTEVGVIPEDWEVICLTAALRRLNAKNHQIPASEYRAFGSHPVVDQSSKRVVGFCENHDKIFEPKGSGVIVFGDHTCVTKFIDFGFVVGADGTQILEALPNHSARFHAFDLAHRPVPQTGYNRHYKFLAERPFLAPTLAEQEAIAGALGDADALIDSLEQLIAKKRLLKQGAMQDLLTGKKRLPGFEGEWEVKRLGDLATLWKGGINPASYPDKQFVHFSLPAFDEGAQPVVEPGSSIGSNKFTVPDGAILVSKLNPRIPRIWAPVWIPEDSVCSTEFLVLVPNSGTDRGFLAALCASPAISGQLKLHAIGTTGSHQRIHPSQALSVEASTPKNLPEQAAIAAILSDMDAEIAALEAKLAKARQVKQGMMQELLTGKTRLV
ncbi:MAG: restriction endonuclease subunit S [Luteolibacter sp.]